MDRIGRMPEKLKCIRRFPCEQRDALGKWRLFQVLYKLYKPDIIYVVNYLRAEPIVRFLPISALYSFFEHVNNAPLFRMLLQVSVEKSFDINLPSILPLLSNN